jgi:hypothetical protein
MSYAAQNIDSYNSLESVDLSRYDFSSIASGLRGLKSEENNDIIS